MDQDRKLTESDVTSLILTIGEQIAYVLLESLVGKDIEIIDLASELAQEMMDFADTPHLRFGRGMMISSAYPSVYGNSDLHDIREEIKTVDDVEKHVDRIDEILHASLKDMVNIPHCYTPDAVESWYDRLGPVEEAHES